MKKANKFLTLMIGNSRLHWGYFKANKLTKTWQTNHINNIEELEKFTVINRLIFQYKIPLYVASVVPSQTKILKKIPQCIVLKKDNIPLKNIYPTLGIDRILALFGGGQIYGFPCLVIDGGTALTFTGGNQNQELVGGAILPGINLQLKSLALNTANLQEITINNKSISRWATNTNDAIKSGIILTLIAGIKNFIDDWLKLFPNSKIIFTGGDGLLLKEYLRLYFDTLETKIITDENLIFLAMNLVINNIKNKDNY